MEAIFSIRPGGFDTTLFFFDDFPRFGAGPGKKRFMKQSGTRSARKLRPVLCRYSMASSEAEWYPFGPKAPSGIVQMSWEFVVQGQAVGVFFGSVSIWVHVVPDEMSNEGESVTEPHHGFMKVVGVVRADDRIDIGGNPHFGYMSQSGHQGFPGAWIRGDVVMHFRSIAVQRHVNVTQAVVHTFLEELLFSEKLSVGDHAAVQAPFSGIGQSGEQQGAEGGFTAGQDDAVVVHFGQIIDETAHFFFAQIHAGGRVGAEVTPLVAVSGELQVAEIGHSIWPRASSGRRLLRLRQPERLFGLPGGLGVWPRRPPTGRRPTRWVQKSLADCAVVLPVADHR